MTKLSSAGKETLREHYVEHYDSDPGFFIHMADVAGIGRKEFQYDLRLSKTYIKKIYDGEVPGPFKRARDTVSIFHKHKRPDLVATILEYIAGSDFNGAVLTAEEREALRVLAKRLGKV